MTKSIKIDTDGSCKFQYPHFLVDVLMIEISKNIFDYDVVYRVKDYKNTIGNFNKIYEEVMGVQNIEIPREEFDKIQADKLFTNSLRIKYKKDMIDKMKEVKNFLDIENIDYECLVLEQIDFKQQVKYFYNANAVIGVHGGGLTNCIFSRENTVVIETEPIRDEYYSKLALCAGMKYYSCGEEPKDIIKTIEGKINEYSI